MSACLHLHRQQAVGLRVDSSAPTVDRLNARSRVTREARVKELCHLQRGECMSVRGATYHGMGCNKLRDFCSVAKTRKNALWLPLSALTGDPRGLTVLSRSGLRSGLAE
jgi:hypothetical protein